jgi:hypothetical protein
MKRKRKRKRGRTISQSFISDMTQVLVGNKSLILRHPVVLIEHKRPVDETSLTAVFDERDERRRKFEYFSKLKGIFPNGRAVFPPLFNLLF